MAAIKHLNRYWIVKRKCTQSFPYALAFALAALAAAIGLSGCSQPLIIRNDENKCAHFDWFELGRKDGSTGLPITHIDNHRARCDETPHPVNPDLYINGRNAGLIDYCVPAKGLEVGKSGLIYQGVCPEHLESGFLKSYKIGKRIRELEVENISIETRIDRIFRRLPANQRGAGVLKPPLKAQIQELRDRLASNNTKINDLENQTLE